DASAVGAVAARQQHSEQKVWESRLAAEPGGEVRRRQGFGLMPLVGERDTEVDARAGAIRLQRKRPLIVRDGILPRAEPIERSAEIVVGIGGVRFELDGLAVVAERLLQPSLVLKRIREVVVGVAEVGLVYQRLAEMRDGLVVPSLLVE